MLSEEEYEKITQEIEEKGQLTELLLLKLIASFLNIEDDEDIEKWRDKNLLLVNQMAKKAKKIIQQNSVTDNDISKTLNLAITTALYNQDLIYKMALDKGLIKNKASVFAPITLVSSLDNSFNISNKLIIPPETTNLLIEQLSS